MKKGKSKILSSSLSELVSKFSQQNIIAEIEKRYQSAPAKLLPTAMIDDCAYISRVKLTEETQDYFASRLKEKGFYNPLVVRTKEDGRYEIILGRKRFFGAKRAGMLSLPGTFAEVEDEEMLLMLLADTRDQREGNVIEMALVCQALQQNFGYTQQTLAELSHQSRCQISNISRMLKLPDELLEAICLGKMSYGHGRALAVLEPSEAEEVGKRVLREGLSVRETEALAQSLRGQMSPARPYQVQIHDNQMILTFSNADELERFKKAKKI